MAVNTTVEVVMPPMGDSVSEGSILEWHKQEGDEVSEGETLVEISTDKVDAEVPSPVAGTVVKFTASLVGARIAGEAPPMARALAISVNARGGPGIVLATTAFAAGIVTAEAFTALIVLALATSVLAGSWLAWMLRADPETERHLREDQPKDEPLVPKP